MDEPPQAVAVVAHPGSLEHLPDGEDAASGMAGQPAPRRLGRGEERLIGADVGVDLVEGPRDGWLQLADREQYRDRLWRVHPLEAVGDEVDADRRPGGRAGVLDTERQVQHARDTEQVRCTPALHGDLAAADVQRPEGPGARERLVPVDEPTL